MPFLSAGGPSVASQSTVTNSGTKMTKATLRDKVANGMELTVSDATAASYMWSREVGTQYPSILDLPRRSPIAAEHLLGLIRNLRT
ncbi:hypothetical protein [Desulfocurvus sp. DL9XJH121]